ncbi:copper homeostasis protein CutC [Chitinophagaceae bacterium MMS25-I14]
MKHELQLEVCAFNMKSCMVAAQTGAARIELCDNRMEGGTTPSYGQIRHAREKLSLQLYPIIRPRGGNFLYNDDEVALMLLDIRMCKELGCDGISTGISLQNGALDMDMMKRITELAYPMKVTCHRVFDLVPDPFETMERLIECGVVRILTSGQQRTAVEGAGLIAQLVTQAAGRISIMPGGGVRAANIALLQQETGAYEFHTAAGLEQPDIVPDEHPGVIDLGKEFITNIAEAEGMIAALSRI